MNRSTQARLGPKAYRDNVHRARRKHVWPVCEKTGKQRLGERKDVKLALVSARHSRDQAEQFDQESSWTVVRGYRCAHCGGWHLTSRAEWS